MNAFKFSLANEDQIREVLIHGNYLSQRDIEICRDFDLNIFGANLETKIFVNYTMSLSQSTQRNVISERLNWHYCRNQLVSNDAQRGFQPRFARPSFYVFHTANPHYLRLVFASEIMIAFPIFLVCFGILMYECK